MESFRFGGTKIEDVYPTAQQSCVPATAPRTKVPKFLSLVIREESGRGPGEVWGEIFRGFWWFLKILECFWRFCGVVLFPFKEKLEVQEGSGRAPGEVPGTFSEGSDVSFWSFEKFLDVLSGFGMVLSAFQRDLRGFGRISGGTGEGEAFAGRQLQVP